MKKNLFVLLLPFALLGPCARAQEAGFEEPPVLSAAAILRPEICSGLGFTVRDEVPTYAGRNGYQIISQYGSFEAEGNTMLQRRVREIAAIARLREISGSDQYKQALTSAAKSPLLVSKGLIENPVSTLSGVPKGLWKFMGRTTAAVKEKVAGQERADAEDPMGKQLIGFSKAKRDVALDLGVDPYSSNPVLQRELNRISWAAFAGKMTFTVATSPVGGGAGIALTVTSVTDTFQKALRDQSPIDLRASNRKQLAAMGCSGAVADAFLDNPVFTPSEQTALVLHLDALAGVDNRSSFIRLATASSDESTALFFVETSRLLALVHGQGTPLERIDALDGLPVGLAKDGRVVVVLEWDYAAWTARAAEFIEKVKGATYENFVPKGVVVGISGEVSPLAKEKLKEAGVQLADRLAPGPLR